MKTTQKFNLVTFHLVNQEGPNTSSFPFASAQFVTTVNYKGTREKTLQQITKIIFGDKKQRLLFNYEERERGRGWRVSRAFTQQERWGVDNY